MDRTTQRVGFDFDDLAPSPSRPKAIRPFASLCTGLALACIPFAAGAQSMTGSWRVVVDERSNTCGDPLAPAEATATSITQSGDLFAIDTPGDPVDQTPIEGKRNGLSLALGFEGFDPGGVTVYDPAAISLTLNSAVTTFSGVAPWEYYSPENCSGTQTWTASRSGAPTPGNLTGANWNIQVVETSDGCGPIDPTPVGFAVSILQSGNLVEILAPDFGQTRFRGKTSGQTLRLGLAVHDDDGSFTVYDQRVNALTVNGGFTSFSGTMSWRSFDALVCTGIDDVVAYLPEPQATAAIAAGCAGLFGLSARRRIRTAGRPFAGLPSTLPR